MNRILKITDIEEAKHELKKINVSSQGIEVMAPKALSTAIKLTAVQLGAANILKQEMLSIGGDAAVARGIVNGKQDISDVILLGNLDKMKKLTKKLDNQAIFGLPEIKNDILNLIEQKTTKSISCRGELLEFKTIKIMGILNVTPDSFSDGNKYLAKDKAVARGLEMIKEGADIIDVGGESTRPGSKKVSTDMELERVIPVIRELHERLKVPISIDTTKAEVALEAIKAGAAIINDISALRFDENMIDVLKQNADIPVILMHMQGQPDNMQNKPYYEDVTEEILLFFEDRINFCLRNGIEQERIILDPGIGFGKRLQDNLMIIKKIAEFKCLDQPLLLGASRKSFLGKISNSQVSERLPGDLATAAVAFENDIEIVRVHDVKEHKRFLKVRQAIRNVR
ncbi:MAG: dihydropteroate synthase [Candidatus Cloacimonetes bacterium]|nr:dihydropteroate synthase [Candidatus Cloacimonadota bacterium]